MKIEIWSDYACPFCYIGEKRLEKALAAWPVEVERVGVWESGRARAEYTRD